MLKAYAAYKASVKPKKNPRKGGSVTKAQSAFNAMDTVGRKIELLDSKSLSSEEKENFISALDILKGIIEAALEAAREPEADAAGEGGGFSMRPCSIYECEVV